MAQATISSVAACSVAYMLDILELSISVIICVCKIVKISKSSFDKGLKACQGGRKKMKICSNATFLGRKCDLMRHEQIAQQYVAQFIEGLGFLLHIVYICSAG